MNRREQTLNAAPRCAPTRREVTASSPTVRLRVYPPSAKTGTNLKRRRVTSIGRADGTIGGAPAGGSQRGYTLIEVIVAFGVLALALTVLLGALSGGTRQIRNADLAGRAALHAQSLLSQIGVGETLTPGRRDGELEGGRYRWTLDVQPWRDPMPAQSPVQPQTFGEPQLFQLALTVQWGEGERERLVVQSLRLVAPDATVGVTL